MTDTSTILKNKYQGNGSATTFDYQFKILEAGEMRAAKTDANGMVSDLVLNTDFSVSGVGNNSGGSVTYPLSGTPLQTGESITLYPSYALTQTLDFTNQDKAYFELFEEGLDRANLKLKMLKEEIDRAVKVGVTTDASPDDYLDAAAGYAASAAAAAEDAEDAVEDAEDAASAAAGSATAAAASATAAAASAAEAASYGGGGSLPEPASGDATRVPFVNSSEDGYELHATLSVNKTDGHILLKNGAKTGRAGYYNDRMQVGSLTNQDVQILQNSNAKMHFATSGNIFVGSTVDTGANTTNSGMTMYPTGSSGNFYAVMNNPAGGVPLALNKGGDGNIIAFYRSNTNVGWISVTSTGTTYGTISDYRLKENVTPMTDALERVALLKPSYYNFIGHEGEIVDGFIAHEVAQVIPHAVTGTKDAVETVTYYEDGQEISAQQPHYQAVDLSKIVPILVGAVQELAQRIEALEQAAQT